MPFTDHQPFNPDNFFQKILLCILLSGTAAYGGTVSCTNGSADPGAIQEAVNGGGTVTITNTCALGGTTIQINNSVRINGNATLNSGAPFAFSVNSDNVSITGLTFNGAGLALRNTPRQSGFVIQNNKIQNTHGYDGIDVDGILTSSLIDSNTFYYVAPDNFLSATYASIGFPGCYQTNSCTVPGVGISIFGGMDQTNVTNNSFDVIANDAVHAGWNRVGAPSQHSLTKNNNISYNAMSRVHRIGLEIQAIWSWPGCGTAGEELCDLASNYSTNTQIKGNYFHDPFLAYVDTYAYSLALWGDGQYINNAGIENVTGACSGVGFGIEDMGNDVLTQGNVIASDYIEGCNPHGWGSPVIYGGQRAGTTFITQNNIFCGDQDMTNVFNHEPNVLGKETNLYNAVMNSCPNAGQLTTSAILMNFGETAVSPGAAKVEVSTESSLPLKYVQFFIDGSNSPAVTQEIQDVNPNFSNDRKWLYHATFDAFTIGAGSHKVLAIATDVAGATKSIGQDFILGS
jgi:hypothetical protein